jgi:predicted amidohydrolase
MKICVAQTRAEKVNIRSNIRNHLNWINAAINHSADLIVFPELSITGYEPALAKDLATMQNDSMFDQFQVISNTNDIAIGIGLPVKSRSGIFISMLIFQAGKNRKSYLKQLLHPDELSYFEQGSGQIILDVANRKIAPAICYESLQEEHSNKAVELGADLYVASVAKSRKGIEKAFLHFPELAIKHSIPVLMANCAGYCDNFECGGRTSVWDPFGRLLGQLSDKSEGILVYDTDTNELYKEEENSTNRS